MYKFTIVIKYDIMLTKRLQMNCFFQIEDKVKKIINDGKSDDYLEFEHAAINGLIFQMESLVNNGFKISNLHTDFLNELILNNQTESISYVLNLGYRPYDSFAYYLGISADEEMIKIFKNYQLISLRKNDYDTQWMLETASEYDNIILFKVLFNYIQDPFKLLKISAISGSSDIFEYLIEGLNPPYRDLTPLLERLQNIDDSDISQSKVIKIKQLINNQKRQLL